MIFSRYRHLVIYSAQPTPTGAELAAIETHLGARLPKSFREFLEVANGGYLEYVIDVPMGNGETERLCFCSIYSTREGTFCDKTFLGELRAERQHTKIPLDVLPFARDGGGSKLYLDLSKEGKGRVVAFVEGLPEWTGLRIESAYLELAKSFDEYVDKLYIERDVVIRALAEEASELADVYAIEESLDIGMPQWRVEDSELLDAVLEAQHRLAPA